MNYIYLKNFYLDDIIQLTQQHINDYYNDNSLLSVEVLMKNSRTYFLQFNQELTKDDVLNWLNLFKQNMPINDRLITLEGYFTNKSVDYKIYLLNQQFYAINSTNDLYKIDHLNQLNLIENSNSTYSSTEIPSKNIHSLAVIKRELPKKKWWKFW